jgi:hypothetical protein
MYRSCYTTLSLQWGEAEYLVRVVAPAGRWDNIFAALRNAACHMHDENYSGANPNQARLFGLPMFSWVFIMHWDLKTYLLHYVQVLLMAVYCCTAFSNIKQHRLCWYILLLSTEFNSAQVLTIIAPRAWLVKILD